MCFDFKEFKAVLGHSYSNYSNWAMKNAGGLMWFRVYRRLHYPVIWGLYLGSFSWLNCLSRVNSRLLIFSSMLNRVTGHFSTLLLNGRLESSMKSLESRRIRRKNTVQMSIFLLKVVGLVRFVNKFSLNRERETQFGKEVLKDFQSLQSLQFL